MARVATGHVDDRPFARTVYALVARRFSGDLVLELRGRHYRVGWQDGSVIAADSSAIGDSVGRVAVEVGLITSQQMGDVLRILAQGGHDELDVVVDIGALSPEQRSGLERLVLGRRAMRIFALPGASFALEQPGTLTADPAPPYDGRWIIYHGVLLHYDEHRLTHELEASIGNRPFVLRPEAAAVLGAFGFTAADKPFLAGLRDNPRTVDQVLAPITDGEARLKAMASIYALAVSSCLEHSDGGSISRTIDTREAVAAARPAPPAKPRKSAPPPRPSAPPVTQPAAPAASPPPRAAARPARPTPAQPRPTAPPAAPAPTSPPREPTPTPAAPPESSAPPELARLIQERLALIDQRADHFAMLGVDRSANVGAVQAAYFALAKQLHPDRLRAFGITDPRAESVFAVVNQAFSVLSDPARRSQYEAKLESRESTGLDEREAEAMALRIMQAEAAFQKGELALRHGSFNAAAAAFAEALELNPDEAEHHAYYAWARWCTADDKEAVDKEVKNLLRKAIRLAPKNAAAYFFRGQIAKHAGQTETAEECFRQVLELDPEHRDADKELRLLVSRTEKKGGLFDRFKGR